MYVGLQVKSDFNETAILVRRSILHHLVHLTGLTHLEATAIQVILAGRPVLILAAYL
jgi:hypothetical protein